MQYSYMYKWIQSYFNKDSSYMQHFFEFNLLREIEPNVRQKGPMVLITRRYLNPVFYACQLRWERLMITLNS